MDEPGTMVVRGQSNCIIIYYIPFHSGERSMQPISLDWPGLASPWGIVQKPNTYIYIPSIPDNARMVILGASSLLAAWNRFIEVIE